MSYNFYMIYSVVSFSLKDLAIKQMISLCRPPSSISLCVAEGGRGGGFGIAHRS